MNFFDHNVKEIDDGPSHTRRTTKNEENGKPIIFFHKEGERYYRCEGADKGRRESSRCLGSTEG